MKQMKRQEGQAFILVLILLALGSLLIVPVLRFTNSGLRAERIYEDAMAKQYAADSALEDALWRMLNDPAVFNMVPGDPAYEFQFGSEGFWARIQIPSIPTSVWTPFQQVRVKADVEPNWLKANAGETTFTYTIRVSMPSWNLTNFGFKLPEGLQYSDSSTFRMGPPGDSEPPLVKGDTIDPDAAVDLTQATPRIWITNNKNPPGNRWVNMIGFTYTEVTDPPPDFQPTNPPYLLIYNEPGGQRLEWLPIFSETGRAVLVQTIQVSGDPGWGIHYINPWFSGNFGSFNTGPTGALGVAMYNILMDVGGVTYQVVVAYEYDPITETEEMKIISYQIVE